MYCLSISVARVKHSGYIRYRVIGKLLQSQKPHSPGRTSNLFWPYIKEQCMFIDFSKLNVQYSGCFPMSNSRTMICSPLVIAGPKRGRPPPGFSIFIGLLVRSLVCLLVRLLVRSLVNSLVCSLVHLWDQILVPTHLLRDKGTWELGN